MIVIRYFIAIVVSLSGCSTNDPSMPVEPSTSKSFQQPGGSVISINGYLVYGSHARQLWSSKAARKLVDTPQCLTLVNTSSHHRVLTSLNGKTVRISGTVRDDVTSGYIDLGSCNKRGIEVISVEEQPR